MGFVCGAHAACMVIGAMCVCVCVFVGDASSAVELHAICVCVLWWQMRCCAKHQLSQSYKSMSRNNKQEATDDSHCGGSWRDAVYDTPNFVNQRIWMTHHSLYTIYTNQPVRTVCAVIKRATCFRYYYAQRNRFGRARSASNDRLLPICLLKVGGRSYPARWELDDAAMTVGCYGSLKWS